MSTNNRANGVDELNDLFDEVLDAADNPDVEWHEFSHRVQRLTRELFHYKRSVGKKTKVE